MKKPWEFKTDDSRKEDTLFTFIIFCEDEVSEFVYFKWFETEKIKINLVPGQKSMMHNVISAITYCKANELFVKDEDKYVLKGEGIEVWCVYDRDLSQNSGLIEKENTEFDMSIETAHSKRINVAWSNDAFELWILLHFIDVDPNGEDTHSRKFYYEELTEIFRNHPAPNDDLQKVLAWKGFNYKEALKRETNFRNIVRPEILNKTNDAISRAKALEEFHTSKDHSHEKRPCTLVFKLVESLLEKGEKPLPK